VLEIRSLEDSWIVGGVANPRRALGVCRVAAFEIPAKLETGNVARDAVVAPR
jgi:hypothetical protein